MSSPASGSIVRVAAAIKRRQERVKSVEFLRFLFFFPRFFRENVTVVPAVFATFSRSKMLFGLRDLPLLRPQLHGLPQPGGGHEGVRRAHGEPESRFSKNTIDFPLKGLHKFQMQIFEGRGSSDPGIRNQIFAPMFRNQDGHYRLNTRQIKHHFSNKNIPFLGNGFLRFVTANAQVKCDATWSTKV